MTQPGQQPDHPYGSYAPYPPGYGYAAPRGQNGLGIAGFVCGLVGLVFCWVPIFGLTLAVVGVALSGTGMSMARKNHQSAGLAIAGLVLGIVALLPAVLILIAIAS